MSRSSGWGLAAGASILAAMLAVGMVFTLLISRNRLRDAAEAVATAVQRADEAEAIATENASTARELESAKSNLQSSYDRLKQKSELDQANLVEAQRELVNARQTLQNEQERSRTLRGLDRGELRAFFPRDTRIRLGLQVFNLEFLQEAFDIDIKVVEGLAARAFNKVDGWKVSTDEPNPDAILRVTLHPQYQTPTGTPNWWTSITGSLWRTVRIPETDLVREVIVLDSLPYLEAVRFGDAAAAYDVVENTFEQMASQFNEQMKGGK